MPLPVPSFLKIPRSPYTKPIPGIGINWSHMHARGLVHSYPVNEGRNGYLKNYVWPRDLYDLKFDQAAAAPLVWGTQQKVPGIHFPALFTAPGPTHIINTGVSSSETTGIHVLPAIDFTKGITIHLWMRPTESLTTTVVSYALLTIGPSSGSNDVIMVGLSRFFGGGKDWWTPNMNVYSNGVAKTAFIPNPQIWEAFFDGSRVKIDTLPYEHVITVHPNGPVRWYGADGADIFCGTLATGITPPDGNQWWPVIGNDDGLGLGKFEGDLWALNIYNYPMGRESAFALMRNPLGMYKIRGAGGIPGEALPPDGGSGGNDPGPGGDGGGLLGDSDICNQLGG